MREGEGYIWKRFKIQGFVKFCGGLCVRVAVTKSPMHITQHRNEDKMNRGVFKIRKIIAACMSAIIFATAIPQSVKAETVSEGDIQERAAQESVSVSDVLRTEAEQSVSSNTIETEIMELPLFTEYTGENYHVALEIEAKWEQHYKAVVTVTNTGDKAIESWGLSFVSRDKIENIWNAVNYEHNEDKYVIKNAGYNQDIAPGESISFGYIAQYEESYVLPEEFKLLGTEKEAADESYFVEYKVVSDWGSGYSATITITNLSEDTIEDWTLAFTFERSIDTIWNAVIESHNDNQYVLKNAGYNQNIESGQSVVIGFNGNDSNTGVEPWNFVLNSLNIEDTEYIELADGKIEKAYLMRAIYPQLLLQNQNIENVRLSDDFDGDGLSLIEEYEYDTNPFAADTDEDGLSDYEEIKVYCTSPIKEDTDDDGMSDGTEVSCGLNPLKKDTDGDGTVDGEEVVRQQVRLDSMEANTLSEVGTLPDIEIVGKGDYSSRLYASAVKEDRNLLDIDCLVGTPFSFVHSEDLSFESSRLTFTVSNEILQKNKLEDLAIAWYNEEENALELLETSYDLDKHAISANVEHYSTYMVVNVPQYFFNIDWENEESIIESGKADVVFVIDTTISMSDRIRNVKDNIEEFVAELEENKVDIRLGLIEYKDIYADGVDSTKSYDWYTSVSAFKNQLSSLFVSGGGDGPESVVDALHCARTMQYRTGVKKYIILVTDAEYKNGTADDPEATMQDEIARLVEEEIVTSVVTAYFCHAFYNELVADTNGVNVDINQNFADALTPLIDKMGEQVNKGCWVRLSNGEVVNLDKNPALGDESVDTDGDGIPDIYELKSSYKVLVNNPYTGKIQEIETWSFYSNPVKRDTDGDGLEDIDDLRPGIYDTVILEENDSCIRFNSGRTWNKVKCTSFDYLDNLLQMVDGKVDNPIPLEEFRAIIESVEGNKGQQFSVDELICIGLLDNEGSKLYLHDKSGDVREVIFRKLTGRESKYYRHTGILWYENWSEVPKGTESGFFKGVVLSEADINFSCKIYNVTDVYSVLSFVAEVGAMIIVIVLVAEATPVVLANIQAVVYYVKTFGVIQGINMYRYLGIWNLPNGTISWLQADMADGDSSLDDLIDNGIPIYQRGKTGEQALAEAHPGESQVYFKTYVDGVWGGRYVDQLSEGVAYESKVGYTCLNTRIKLQILKDEYLLQEKRVKGVIWEFYRSDITGKVGASKPLIKFLSEHGISIVIHE